MKTTSNEYNKIKIKKNNKNNNTGDNKILCVENNTCRVTGKPCIYYYYYYYYYYLTTTPTI